MNEIFKAARVEKQVLNADELKLINVQAIVPQTADSVFAFKLVACDNQVDRDEERFSNRTLDQFAEMFVGRPMLRDHDWSANNQIARIYAGSVENSGGVKRLVLRAYMPRNERAAPTIADIEAGILREVSVGVAVKNCLCSICGEDYTLRNCGHRRGEEYDGKQCHVVLDDAQDTFETSFVAVPAQRNAGVVKRYEAVEKNKKDPAATGDETNSALRLAHAMQEMEEKRYGGY